MKFALDDDFDPDTLDEAEYDDSFDSYEGPLPPDGTILRMKAVRMWAGYKDADFQFVVSWQAQGNTGKLSKFEGFTMLDFIIYSERTAFRYQPFNAALGITSKQVKAGLHTEEDEERFGKRVIRILKWKPDTEAAVCEIKIKASLWEGVTRLKPGKYIAIDTDADPELEEEEQEEAPPARTRRTAAKPAAATTRTRKAKAAAPPPDDDDDDEEDEDGDPF